MNETAAAAPAVITASEPSELMPQRPFNLRSLGGALARYRYPELAVLFAFTIVVSLLALFTGAPIIFPNRGAAIAVGIHYGFPLVLVILWNFVPVVTYLRNGKDQRSIRSLVAAFGRDFGFLLIFLAVMVLHFNVKLWMGLVNPTLYDPVYQQIDLLLAPIVDGASQLRLFFDRTLPGTQHYYHWCFILMFFLSFTLHRIFDRSHFRHLFLSSLLVQVIGCLSYLILPALGPFIYDPSVVSYPGGAQQSMLQIYKHVLVYGVPWIEYAGANVLASAPAAMPSLHVGASCVFLYFAARYQRFLLPLYVPLFLWILMDAMALKWHYLIDLPAGLAVGALSIWVAGMFHVTRGKAPEPNALRNSQII